MKWNTRDKRIYAAAVGTAFVVTGLIVYWRSFGTEVATAIAVAAAIWAFNARGDD